MLKMQRSSNKLNTQTPSKLLDKLPCDPSWLSVGRLVGLSAIIPKRAGMNIHIIGLNRKSEKIYCVFLYINFHALQSFPNLGSP